MSGREAEIRSRIAASLEYVLDECVLPELGNAQKGKVRDVYFHQGNVVMVTNDRVSAFDFVLPNLIPFKGQVLNIISDWAMRQTSDIVPNALAFGKQPDPNVVVQKKMKNLKVECIVRGYLWGSMANSYEKGERDFCGLKIPEGLLRYQKLDEPIFTPTTKAEVGHDENMTMDELKKFVGDELALKLKETSLALFARGQEIMRKVGLILLDTKYEFGVDEDNKLHVIDEVNTPDSSRMVDIEEYESKYPQIAKAFEEASKSGQPFANVSKLLDKHTSLKIKEFSKQYVRDVLLSMGFDGKGPLQLSNEVVIECSYRYVAVCERLTGLPFPFPLDSDGADSLILRQRLVSNLQRTGILSPAGGVALIFAGSDSDAPHINKLVDQLATFKIPSVVRICSAHKQPAKLEETLNYYNRSAQACVIVACAGGTDALSGTASFHSLHPVVSCPPDGLDNRTCLTNPPGSSNAFIARPDNLARFVAQTFSSRSLFLQKYIVSNAKEKVDKLVKADVKFQSGK